jgi:ABC-2 type transport system permease protein
MTAARTTSERWPVVALASAARRVSRERGTLVVTLGFYAVVATTIATLWRTAAHASPTGTVAGYDARQFAWYLTISEAVTIALNQRLIEDIGVEIANGSIAVELLRPVSVLGLRVANEIGRCLPRLLGCVALGMVLATVMEGGPPHLGALALALPATVLAVTCNLVAQHLFAAAAFWVRDARSTWFLYQKLVFILGGMLIPLQVMPHALHAVASWLPFMAMAYVPARLASGHVEPQLLLVQAAWIVVLSAGAVAVFAAGERRLQVVGG